MPKIFFLLFKIPAILLTEPLGLEFSFILPFSSQYLKAIKFLSSREFISFALAK
jgi:hypothetical protein